MKFLLDMQFRLCCLLFLKAMGMQEFMLIKLARGVATDQELLEIARREERVVITADLDFPRLLALSSATGPGLILFRGGNYSDIEMCALLERVLKEVAAETLAKSICVIDKKRVRVTQLPLT